MNAPLNALSFALALFVTTRGAAAAPPVKAAPSPAPTASARGEGSSDEVTAEALFASGKESMAAHRWDDACAKFDASRKLSPGIGVTMWLADCHEKAGRLASAWLYFRDAASLARRQSDARAALAEDRAKSLETRVPKVRVSAQGFQGAVYRDGVALPSAALDVATPVDPGRYRYSFVPNGGASCESIVDVAADPHVVVVAPDARCTALATSAPTTLATDVRTATEKPARSRPTTLGYALVGVAAVSAGIGTYYGVHAINLDDRSNEGPCAGNTCNADGVRLRDDAFTSATVSTIAISVSAVALTAAVLIFTGLFDGAPSATKTAARGLTW